MNIGFDAKRAYFNSTGLGNYSRTLIHALCQYFPEHHYFAFTPKKQTTYILDNAIHVVQPETTFDITFNSLWRSKNCIEAIIKNNINLYHGLSHELPYGLQHMKVKKVVTIHDLIPERYPNQYTRWDKYIYQKKIKHACKIADKIIAISHQTKDDLIDYYSIDKYKIEVAYPSIDARFYNMHTDLEKKNIKAKYKLPTSFLLFVGSIIERKNVLTLCKVLTKLKDIPLVIIGKGSTYKEEVKKFISQHELEHRILFLEDKFNAEDIQQDLPCIYQSAHAFIYPSLFEGFGLPVLEALASGVPCITSDRSSMPEAGGHAALYINPLDEAEIMQAIMRVNTDTTKRNEMITQGYLHAQQFTNENCAKRMMSMYKKI